ncbi:MAG: glycosyltransferase [Ilumatobacteraceae bacterium]
MRIGTRTWAARQPSTTASTPRRSPSTPTPRSSVVLRPDPSRQGHGAAIEVARRSGRRLDIAGIIQDERYFHEAVEPHLDDRNVRYLGPVSAADRAEVLGSAHALLHLIDFDEPFGYSVVEAMACGTPVVAYRRGSMAELIRHGVNGLLVDDVEGAVRAVDVVGDLDRSLIRSITVERFDVAAMVERYVEVYRSILRDD